MGVGMNVGYLVGHNAIRRAVMGMEDRASTSEELAEMTAMVAQAMEEGDWGISTGFKYLRGAFSEVIEIGCRAQIPVVQRDPDGDHRKDSPVHHLTPSF